MEFTMTIKTGEEFTEDEVDEIMETFGDNYDSANIEPFEIEVDGIARQRQVLAYIMLVIRQIIGWNRATFAVEFSR